MRLELDVVRAGLPGRVLEHEPARDVRAAMGELHRHGRTERMADEGVDRRDRERLDGRRHVGREALGGGHAVDPRARAVAAQVDRDDAPATIRQRGTDAPPGSPPAGDAVDENGDRRGIGGAASVRAGGHSCVASRFDCDIGRS